MRNGTAANNSMTLQNELFYHGHPTWKALLACSPLLACPSRTEAQYKGGGRVLRADGYGACAKKETAAAPACSGGHCSHSAEQSR